MASLAPSTTTPAQVRQDPSSKRSDEDVPGTQLAPRGRLSNPKAGTVCDGLLLRPIHARVQKDTGWSTARVTTAVKEYRRWLYLCALPGALKSHKLGMGPSDVDEVWHTHIIFTQKYMADCKALLGFYLHHKPSEEGVVTVAKGQVPRGDPVYEETLKLYEQEFGEQSPLWFGTQQQQQDPATPHTPKPSSAGAGTAWVCSSCTLPNKPAATHCAMCDTARHGSSSRSSSGSSSGGGGGHKAAKPCYPATMRHNPMPTMPVPAKT